MRETAPRHSADVVLAASGIEHMGVLGLVDQVLRQTSDGYTWGWTTLRWRSIATRMAKPGRRPPTAVIFSYSRPMIRASSNSEPSWARCGVCGGHPDTRCRHRGGDRTWLALRCLSGGAGRSRLCGQSSGTSGRLRRANGAFICSGSNGSRVHKSLSHMGSRFQQVRAAASVRNPRKL